jgi:hypothetical protein
MIGPRDTTASAMNGRAIGWSVTPPGPQAIAVAATGWAWITAPTSGRRW